VSIENGLKEATTGNLKPHSKTRALDEKWI